MRPERDSSDADLLQAKAIVAEFASALRGPNKLSIEHVVASTPGRLKKFVIGELLRTELEFLGEFGTIPTLDSYCKRFPEDADVVVECYRNVMNQRGRSASPESKDDAVDETRFASHASRQQDISQTSDLRESRTDGAADAPFFFVPELEKENKYVVVTEIDRGGMGVVLKVKDLHLNRTLAMKVIRGQADSASGSSDRHAAEKLERFIREASITGRLEHPGVIPVHELGKDGRGRSYFTMKFVQGKTLRNVLRELHDGKCDQAHVIEVLVRVCDTIAFAHSKGVIHRDLKPANIMVGEFGETYVMDWGLAKVLRETEISLLDRASSSVERGLDADISQTMHGSVIGTPHYMPPEQAAGRIDDLNERSDIYSIGAMLYQMLSGHKPFDEQKTALDVVQSVRSRTPVPILEHSRKAPAELVAIANKAMQQKQEDRYQSATELADDLRAFLSNRVVTAYRTGTLAAIEKWLVRNRSIVGTAALILIVSLGVISLLQYRNNIEVSAKSDEVLETNRSLENLNRELDKKKGELEESLESEKEANRNEKEAYNRLWGQKLVLQANNILTEKSDATLASLLAIEALDTYKYEGVDTQSTIYAGASKLSENLILEGHEDDVPVAIFSPDGKQALTISVDGTGIVWDAITGNQISLILNKVEPGLKTSARFDTAVFSKSGNQVLAAGSAGTVGIWETQTGVRKLSIDIDNAAAGVTARPNVSRIQFFPDEKRLVAATSSGLFLFDSTTGEQVGILKTDPESGLDEVRSLRISPDGTRVIASSRNGRFFVWDAKSRQLIKSSQVPAKAEDHFQQLDFNFDGSLFVTVFDSLSAESQSPARIWQTETGELHSEVNLGAGISAAAFHPTRNLLVVGVDNLFDPSLQVWDLEAKEVIAIFGKLPTAARSIRFAPASDAFVVICGQSQMSVWELESTDLNQTMVRHVENLVGHDREIYDARFDASGARIISASNDRTARIWNVFAERPVPLLGRTWFPESAFTDSSIKVNSKGNRILTLAADRNSRILWSYPELELIRKITINDPIYNWQFSSDGELVFGGSNSGNSACWKASDGSFVREFKNVGRLFTAAYDPTKQRVLLNTSEKTSVWNLASEDEQPEHEFLKSEDDFHMLSQDGSVALGFSHPDDVLRQFNIETGEVRTISIDTCQAVSFSADGRYIWCRGPQFEGDTGMNSTSIMILDANTLSIKHTIEDTEAGYDRWIKWADFSSDSSKIWIQHYRMRGELADGPAISIWSTVDGTKVCEFGEYGPETYIVPGGTNADCSRLLLNTNQGVQLVDGTNGQLIATLPLSLGKLQKAAFSHDGQIYISQEVSDTKNPVTGRTESRVALWNAKSGELLANLPYEQNLFLWGFLPGSNRFLTVSELNEVQVWPVDILDETKKHLARTLSPIEQDAYLAETTVRSSFDQRQSEFAYLENRIRLLGPITADRRAEAWSVLAQLNSWLGENPSQSDLDLAIESSNALLSGPFDSDPRILIAIADFHDKSRDPLSVIRLLEQASRHPRGLLEQAEIEQLETARKAIAPAIASFRSADWLAKLRQQDPVKSGRYEAATTWAKQNDIPLYQYLTAQKCYLNKDYDSAAELLKSVVESNPTESEPYLLYASCLRQQSNPKDAADVLRRALDMDQCRSPEIWSTWLQISFNDLGRSPNQLLADLPDASDDFTTEPKFGDHVSWLLTQLVKAKPLRINSGCYTDVTVGGENWSMDRFYTFGLGFWEQDGEAKLSAKPIDGTERDILYQSERYFPTSRHQSPAGYQVPLPNGKYEITLGFSEIYQALRSFDVEVENKSILKDYDPARGEFATAEEFKCEVEVSDGLLNVVFDSNNVTPAKISTIAIEQIKK